MNHAVDVSSLLGYRVIAVESGTIISDPFGKSPDITVDDSTVAVRLGTIFVTGKVLERLQDRVTEKRP